MKVKILKVKDGIIEPLDQFNASCGMTACMCGCNGTGHGDLPGDSCGSDDFCNEPCWQATFGC